MKIWEKMKSESKTYHRNIKQSSTRTGGGPCILKIDPILEQVCTILGRACTGIIGVPDCDDESEDGASKVLIVEDVPHIQVEVVASETDPNNLAFSAEEPNNNTDSQHSGAEHILRTPLWSRRRRPQLSQTNERSEAVTSLCTSFQAVNKKKSDIEELKMQLIKNELEFKKELYAIQLQTAAKELEIKSEVLSQIKGGGLSLQNLFGVPQSRE